MRKKQQQQQKRVRKKRKKKVDRFSFVSTKFGWILEGVGGVVMGFLDLWRKGGQDWCWRFYVICCNYRFSPLHRMFRLFLSFLSLSLFTVYWSVSLFTFYLSFLSLSLSLYRLLVLSSLSLSLSLPSTCLSLFLFQFHYVVRNFYLRNLTTRHIHIHIYTLFCFELPFAPLITPPSFMYSH